ncbi:accessory Sec system S-layer assembly protein [Halobacillus karajensis]|uniref:accessory Sec system S-layer assembly protein n=1 Tax=Halobacillus karajensis TaxID=195088 RepID=UPI0008A77689|nr:accessory Sec system S-layer assembly protein [Halobacillus karajensis]SEH44233.1 accessory Sec system S-layer assembly protein [Halobacillus karajensis]
MFNFKKKKESPQEQGFDASGVNAEGFAGDRHLSEEDTEIYTDLSIHPDWHLPEEEVYVYRFLNQELPPLRPNQVSVYGVEVKEKDGGLIVDAFVRNSLRKGIKMKTASILILDKQGETIARKTFDLTKVGTIPGGASRPWTFLFPPSSVFHDAGNLPVHGWRLALELKQTTEHTLDLDERWKEALTIEDFTKLKKLVSPLSPPKNGEVNFFSLYASQSDQGDLHVNLLIRNGSNKDLTLRNLPLRVEDATEEVIAEGGFQLNSLLVKAHTSKPWAFVFPADTLAKTEIDLSKWKAYPVK